MNWLPVIVAGLAVLGAGGGIYSVFTLGATRRKLIAEAASLNASTTTVLTKSAMDLITPLREEAAEARAEVKSLRVEVRELTGMLRRWRSAILDPGATVESLRALVATDHVNGSR